MFDHVGRQREATSPGAARSTDAGAGSRSAGRKWRSGRRAQGAVGLQRNGRRSPAFWVCEREPYGTTGTHVAFACDDRGDGRCVPRGALAAGRRGQRRAGNPASMTDADVLRRVRPRPGRQQRRGGLPQGLRAAMATERAVERRVVTVLFADLVGFTSLSEELDAEDVTLVQDAYFDAVRETVARHGGQLEKFVGDAAMAVFGAPRVRDDDAERAVRAGLALVAAVQRVGAGLGLAAGRAPPARRRHERRDRLRRGERRARGGHRRRGERRGAAAGGGGARDGDGRRGHGARGRGRDRAGAPAAVRAQGEGRARSGLAGRRRPCRTVAGARARRAARADARARRRGRAPSLRSSARPPGSRSSRRPAWARRGCSTSSRRAATGAAVLRARLRPDVLSPFEPVAQLAGGTRTPTELVALARAAGATERARGRRRRAPRRRRLPPRRIPPPSASSSSRPGSRGSTRSPASAPRCGWSRTSTGPRRTCSHSSSSPEARRGAPDASSWRARGRSCSTSGRSGWKR